MNHPEKLAMARHIVMKAIADLAPYEKNARTHSDAQVDQIGASILEFGFTNPILVDSEQGIIAGHGRLLAAQKLGLSEVPVVVLDHLTPIQKRAYIIADNKLAELAGWDEKLLAEELADLRDVDYPLDVIGFDDQELEGLFSSLYETDSDNEAENALPEVEDNPVSQLGQVWVLGDHKVMCGDARDEANFKLLLGEALADLTFTDPPYNVNYGETMKDKFRNLSGKRAILNDNLGEGFEQFLRECCQHIIQFTKGACYICMSSSELHTLQKAFCDAGGHWSTFIVWAKNTFTLGRADYQRQYEPILYGWPAGTDHFWCGDRNQGDVWFFNKPQKNDLHPTMKPVELCERAILNSSKTKDIILDCFGGSGTTLIACEKVNRRCRMIELDPKYVDVIIKRWQDYTGEQAIDEKTGKPFNTLLLEHEQDEATDAEKN